MEKTRFFLLLTMLFLICPVSCLAMTIPNISTDQSALLALKKHITFDPDNLLTNNWTIGTSVCSWIGVVCSSRHKRVAALNIPNMGLMGTIPPPLGNLSFLVQLNIRNNSFHGHLPKELSNLRRLKYIGFAFNNFFGQVPSWFGALTELRFLSVGNNSFTGTFPASLSNISTLETLYLYSNQLYGKLPLEIGNLRKLKDIDTEDNHLTGSIPLSIFNISSLESIAFSSNGLSGNLPADMWRGHCNLGFLYLSYNAINGEIPPNLFRCSELQIVSMAYNKFTGPIAPEIGNLTMLNGLYLGGNNLKGLLPSTIFNLSSLTTITLETNGLSKNFSTDLCHHFPMLEGLYFSTNNFTGILPSSSVNCSFLKIMDLSFNNFAGELPSNIGVGLPNIQELYFAANKLSGIIPSSIANASKLTMLDLGINSFTGFIPNTIGNLEYLDMLDVATNNLTSESVTSQPSFLTSLMKCKHLRSLWIANNPLNIVIPATIWNLSNFESLWADNSRILGNIPRLISNLSKLVDIHLHNNALTGVIPSNVGQLKKLQYFDVGGNELRGSIPSSICELRDLAFLFLHGNELSGSLPTCFENLTSLRTLRVDSNGITLVIPLSLWNLKDLLVLNLSSNSLTGELPLEIENLKVVNQIDLSRNQLSGDIPSSIGKLQNLLNLSLASNKLQGPIPDSFGGLISLESLDLSHNNLSGEIPKSLEDLLFLKYLNLSANKLEGEIPEGGPFANFSAQSVMGNTALCGGPRFQVQPCHASHDRSTRKMVRVMKYVLPIFGSIVLIALVLVFVLTRCRKRKMNIPNQEDLFHMAAPKRFSYQELVQATSGFAECNLLGTGSFGSVYRGTLSDGMMVAVKVFDLGHEGSLKSFDIECEVMRNARHRNLVKVIGSCSNLDFKALVISYMSNGNLDKWLYNLGYCLDILQRMSIMIDVASALEYLHHGYSTPVVHCDVKPSNVLLDENMVAHLGDYGLAKLFSKQESMAQTKTLATIGYIAPEYGLEGIVSTKGDVYSYGVMLMETFTGKKPTHEMFVGEMSLKQWVNRSLCYVVIEVMDANILMRDDKHFIAKEHCIKSVMKLAISCCADSPEERVNMKNVVITLEKIKVEFLANIDVA